MRSLLIRGGRLVDPARGVDRVEDLAIRDGVFAAADGPAWDAVFDATGLLVCPGLVDIHVHLREPGFTHKEDIASGTSAAVAGGFTAVACMPNTSPALDTPASVRQVLERAAEVGACHVWPIAAITRHRAGKELTDFEALLAAGAVAFSDDGDGVDDDAVMRAAFERARALDAVLIQHCEFKSISAGGVVHRGATAERLGFPGIDPRAEEAMIERDLHLVRRTRARYHVAHVSTAVSVELVRRAKAEGLPVTAEVCPHHLLLTDADCESGDPNFKMNPPLRAEWDREACLSGFLDGTIDCIVSDHAPHASDEKAAGFAKAPFGIVGLETTIPLLGTQLIKTGLASWETVIAGMSANCGRVLGRPIQTTVIGQRGCLTLIDPAWQGTIRPEEFRSKSRNTPFGGWGVSVRVGATAIDGRIAYLHPDYAGRLGTPQEK